MPASIAIGVSRIETQRYDARMHPIYRFFIVAVCLLLLGVGLFFYLAEAGITNLWFHDMRNATMMSFGILAAVAAVGWIWMWRPNYGPVSWPIAGRVGSAVFLIVEVGSLAIVNGFFAGSNGIY